MAEMLAMPGKGREVNEPAVYTPEMPEVGFVLRRSLGIVVPVVVDGEVKRRCLRGRDIEACEKYENEGADWELAINGVRYTWDYWSHRKRPGEECDEEVAGFCVRRQTDEQVEMIWRELLSLGLSSPEPSSSKAIVGVAAPVGPRIMDGGLAWLISAHVDDPAYVGEVEKALGPGLCFKMEPRCPIDGERRGIWCNIIRGTCRHKDHEFGLKEAPRDVMCLYLVKDGLEELAKLPAVVKLYGGVVYVYIHSHLVKVPPSYHSSGAKYEWLRESIALPIVEASKALGLIGGVVFTKLDPS